MNRWTVLVYDGRGEVDKAELEIYIAANGAIASQSYRFTDIAPDNTGKVNGIDVSDDTVTITHDATGNDLVISVSVTGQSIDSIGEGNDSLSWDIRVEGFDNSTYVLNGDSSSVTLGTEDQKIASGYPDIGTGSTGILGSADSVRITVENLQYTADAGTEISFSGFTGHWASVGDYIFGEGTGLEHYSVLNNGELVYNRDYEELVVTTVTADRVRYLNGYFSVVSNNAPYFRVAYLSQYAVAGESYYAELAGLAAEASDDDGDGITYSMVSGPSWFTVSDAGVLSGSPSVTDSGDYEVVVQASDSAGGADQFVIELSVLPVGYGTYISSYTGVNDAGVAGDADGDGCPNVLEYMFMTDPTVKEGATVETYGGWTSTASFQLKRNPDSVVDTSQRFEYSADLLNWTSIDISTDAATEVSFGEVDENGRQAVNVTVGEVAETSTRLFWRVAVETL